MPLGSRTCSLNYLLFNVFDTWFAFFSILNSVFVFSLVCWVIMLICFSGALFTERTSVLPSSNVHIFSFASAAFYSLLCICIHCSSTACFAGAQLKHFLPPNHVLNHAWSRALIAAVVLPALPTLALHGNNSLLVTLNSHVTLRLCLESLCWGMWSSFSNSMNHEYFIGSGGHP